MENLQGPQEHRSEDQEYKIRHSLAHVLAQAVLTLRPGSKLGFGPPIKDGFYYDFILTSPLSEEDFPELEKIMKKILKDGQKFAREDLSLQEGLQRLNEMGEPYKKEYAQELGSKHSLTSLSFYRNGSFLDMCEGPHVNSTREIPAGCFKLRSVAGAYWRGDSKNQMMSRIYAWAFESKEKLEAEVKAFEEALARDHKKLGKELEIFHIDDEVGKGLPLWLPNGTILRDEIEKLMKELEFKGGYQRVATPHLTKEELYHKTGHLPYYKHGMYPIMETKEIDEEGNEVVKETYCLRPMNCPHHHRIFAFKKRSYRELPLRLAEFGQVYRFEDSGSLSGLLRVRGMCQNDAHIYCTEEQIQSEFLKVMQLHKDLYDIMGLKDYYLRFSTWDPEDPKGKEKYVNNPAAWEKSQKLVYAAMLESGLPFTEGKGEAAFYGPKIDFQFRTVTGREETASTNQLDFAVPERLDLKYVGMDNQEYHPYVIHRAPAGTHERFIAFLIEHFAGAFPTWLAPVQVKIITVADKFNEYAESITQQLRQNYVRAEVDTTDYSFNKKIRTNTTRKIPHILIIGEKEALEGTITLRRYGIQEQQVMKVQQFIDFIMQKIQSRSLTLD